MTDLTNLIKLTPRPDAAGACPYCSTPTIRRNAAGAEVGTADPRIRNCSTTVRLLPDVEALVCPACNRAFSVTADDDRALDAALQATWRVKLRRKLGVRMHRDDELSLGVTWGLCHMHRPLELFVFGLQISIGWFDGDEPRFRARAMPTMRGVWDALRRQEDPGALEPNHVHRWTAGAGYGGIFSSFRHPGFMGIGVSLWLGRAQENRFSWRLAFHIGPWRLWFGRVVFRKPGRSRDLQRLFRRREQSEVETTEGQRV